MSDETPDRTESSSEDALDRDSTLGGSQPAKRPVRSEDISIGGFPTLGGPGERVSGGEDWAGLELSGGRYRVTEKLGEGGMGVVYRAMDARLETDVVIKVPHAYLLRDAGFMTRFSREIGSLVRLSHPHVCPVTDVGDEGSVPFAVMKYLGGGSLQSRRPRDSDGREAPMTMNQLVLWVTNIAQALDFIHGQGYVHRDVKPSNILFDAHGNVYLSDFGIVRAAAGVEQPGHTVSLTGTGALLGTPEYMAPELIMGHEYDGRVDQYALGIVVYELLTGRRPFSGPSPSAIMVEQATGAPPNPRELNRSIPGRSVPGQGPQRPPLLARARGPQGPDHQGLHPDAGEVTVCNHDHPMET